MYCTVRPHLMRALHRDPCRSRQDRHAWCNAPLCTQPIPEEHTDRRVVGQQWVNVLMYLDIPFADLRRHRELMGRELSARSVLSTTSSCSMLLSAAFLTSIVTWPVFTLCVSSWTGAGRLPYACSSGTQTPLPGQRHELFLQGMACAVNVLGTRHIPQRAHRTSTEPRTCRPCSRTGLRSHRSGMAGIVARAIRCRRFVFS